MVSTNEEFLSMSKPKVEEVKEIEDVLVLKDLVPL